jgi:hypothetical protein
MDSDKSMKSCLYLSFYIATIPFDFSKKLDNTKCNQLDRILKSLRVVIDNTFETEHTEERFGNLIKSRIGVHFRTIEMYVSLMLLWYKVSFSFDDSGEYKTLQAMVKSKRLESELKRAFELIILPPRDVPTIFITKTVEAATYSSEFSETAVYTLWMSVLGGNETLYSVLLSASSSTESKIFKFSKMLVSRILDWICLGGRRSLNSEDGRVFSLILSYAITCASFRAFITLIKPSSDVLNEYNVKNVTFYENIMSKVNDGNMFHAFLVTCAHPASKSSYVIDYDAELNWNKSIASRYDLQFDWLMIKRCLDSSSPFLAFYFITLQYTFGQKSIRIGQLNCLILSTHYLLRSLKNVLSLKMPMEVSQDCLKLAQIATLRRLGSMHCSYEFGVN